jgi:hypothetical protein
MLKKPSDYELSVFINCPFDKDYRPLFEAIVFAVQIAGFKARCSLEADNAGQARLEKIMSIIAECKYGIHDISRTELNNKKLPRFNMPLELGIDLGCREFGAILHKDKKLLIMDKKEHRYQQFISDISGQDIKAHNTNLKLIISMIRDWLRTESRNDDIPGGFYMYKRYKVFQKKLPDLRKALKLDLKNLPFADLSYTMHIWLEENEV